MKKIRAFLGVSISAALRDRLLALQGELQSRLTAVDWVKPESIHLTLKFLGSIPISQVEEITEVVASIAGQREPFDCGVRGVGSFPDSRAPRILWVGVKGGNTELEELRLDLDSALASLGFPIDERAFQPHLTLARIKTAFEDIGRILNRDGVLQETHDFGTLRVERITLFRSELGASGATYEPLSTMPLALSTRSLAVEPKD